MSFVDAAGDRPRTPAALPEELGFGRYFTERMFVQRQTRNAAGTKVTEVFCIGTAAVVAPIGRIGFRGRDFEVSGARSATVTRRLYEALTDIQYGRVPDPYGWSVPLDVEVATAV